jgi:hypothetical protein
LEVAELITTIRNRYDFYSSLLILIIGIVGNILIIFIFTTLRLFRDNRSAYYLAIESTSNIGLLLALLPSNIVGDIWGQNPSRLSVVWCKIQLASSYGFGFYSLFTICFLALDQYLSTHHRVVWRQISTLRLAHRLTFCQISFVLVHGIFFTVFAEIGSVGCGIYNTIAKIYFQIVYSSIFGGVFPVFLSILFSLLAYLNVRRIVRRQIPLERRRLDRQMTAIALARVICLVILGIPFIVFNLIRFILSYGNDEYIKIAILNLLSSIINLLLYTNFSVS